MNLSLYIEFLFFHFLVPNGYFKIVLPEAYASLNPIVDITPVILLFLAFIWQAAISLYEIFNNLISNFLKTLLYSIKIMKFSISMIFSRWYRKNSFLHVTCPCLFRCIDSNVFYAYFFSHTMLIIYIVSCMYQTKIKNINIFI